MIFLHIFKYGLMTGAFLISSMCAYFLMHRIVIALLIWLPSHFQLLLFCLSAEHNKQLHSFSFSFFLFSSLLVDYSLRMKLLKFLKLCSKFCWINLSAGVCCCCAALRPRYKRLVDNIFPEDPKVSEDLKL